MSPAVRSLVSDQRLILALYFVITAAFAAITTMRPHHVWALFALAGYGLAFLVALVRPRSPAGPFVALTGAVIVPTLVLCVGHLRQPEVGVAISGFGHWLRTGSPYLDSPSRLAQYRPYLPATFLVAAPAKLLGGVLADPRIVSMLGLLVAAYVPLRSGRRGGSRGRWDIELGETWRRGGAASLALTLACPLVALQVAASFVDIPQAACLLASFALVGRGRNGWAGVTTGAAISMKPTALVVAFVMLLFVARARRDEQATGSLWRDEVRASVAFTAGAGVMVAALVGPVVMTDPQGLWRNVFLFPLGLTDTESPAQSPFPGVLMRQAWPDASWPSVLTAVVALAYALFCVRAVDDSVTRAAGLAAVGLVLAFALAPNSRAGYLCVPVLISFTVRAWRAPRGRTLKTGDCREATARRGQQVSARHEQPGRTAAGQPLRGLRSSGSRGLPGEHTSPGPPAPTH